jgi:hypothetical protein
MLKLYVLIYKKLLKYQTLKLVSAVSADFHILKHIVSAL